MKLNVCFYDWYGVLLVALHVNATITCHQFVMFVIYIFGLFGWDVKNK